MPSPAARASRAKELLLTAARAAGRQGGDLATRVSAPARTLATAVRGRSTVVGLRHVPERGPAIIAANHRHVLDARVLAATLPRPVRTVDAMELAAAVSARRAGRDPRRADAWSAALDELAGGGLVAVLPEAQPSPDTNLHKGRDSIGWLVLAAGVPVVPAALDTRSALLLLGPAMDFRRFEGLDADRTLARGVTDEIMGAIADLGALRYVDTYPTTAREQIRSDARRRMDERRDRSIERRLAERRAVEDRRAYLLEEQRDLAERHLQAEIEARLLSERAAERDRDRRRAGDVPGGGDL